MKIVRAKHVVQMPLTLLFCLMTGVPLLAQGLGRRPADETAIREVVKRYLDPREHQDAKAVEDLFTSDADQLVSSGEWRKGRSEVVRGTLASSQRTDRKRTIAIESVRFVAPGVALADGRYEISGPAGSESRKMWTTFLLTRGPKNWQIAAIRNMLPAPPTPASSK
jgi:uncharacterized protein (TIGR02246 family)